MQCNRRIIVVYPLIFLCSLLVKAQNTAEIQIKVDSRYENVYSFEVVNEPPLDQIPGAPEAFYEYFWEFGDGSYSFEEKPTHVYKDFGNGDVLVALTNNYSNGGAPPTRPKKKRKKKDQPPPPNTALASNWKEPNEINSSLEDNQAIGLITNHSPRPRDPMVAVLSYKNNGLLGTSPNFPQDGRLYLFYNEKSFGYNNFGFQESRQHAGETFSQSLPTTELAWQNTSRPETLWASNKSLDLEETTGIPLDAQHKDIVLHDAKEKYKNVLTWEFKDLQNSEVRNIFCTFLTTPEMIRDTTSTITFQAVLVPQNSFVAETYTLALTVQASHDPNKMFVSERHIKKRDIQKKGLVYTIKFQNIGRGPASNIVIENKLHPSLDASSIEVLDYYPKTVWCDGFDSLAITSCHDTLVSEGMVTWKLNNIYLPGTRQQDRESKKATKGWIKYSIMPKKKIKGRRLRSRAYIYFDRNPPIATNQVRTSIDKARSIGFKGGLNNIEHDFKHLFGGITWATFRPKGFYHQGELMVSEEGFGFSDAEFDVALGTDPTGNTLFGDRFTNYNYSLLFIDVVPLQIRKNLLRLVSVGAGAQLSILLRADEEVEVRRVFSQTGMAEEMETTSTRIVDLLDGMDDSRFNTVEPGVFLDVNVGPVVKGPNLGVRAIWKNNKRVAMDSREDPDSEVRTYLQVYFQYKW